MEFDVIIIGAGPAGLSCAIELQNSNKKVLLLEKNDRIGPKVCAGGLTTKIEKLGLSLDIADVTFNSIVISISGQETSVQSDKPFVATIDREKLGTLLRNKISNNVEIRTGVRVHAIGNNNVSTNKDRFGFAYLVGADGSNSMVRQHMGLQTRKSLTALQYKIPREYDQLELYFDVRLFSSGYAWIFPHKGYTSVGCCCQNGTFKDNHKLLHNFKTWLRKKGISTEGSQLEGSVINFDYQGFDFGNVFLAGDAGGFASGLTGEGMFFAMVSGREIARKIMTPSYKCTEINKILHIKRIHERALAIMTSFGSQSTYICHNLLPLLFKSQRFKEFAITTFS